MAKRFTDTEKWRDPWFCSLSSDEKIFWGLLLDTCNLAGIWQVNWPLVKFYLPNFEFKQDIFKERIQILNEEKWFVPKFLKFQYGELQPSNRLHQRIIFELQKEGVSIPLKHPSQGVKDKDMDKESLSLFDSMWLRYPRKDGRKEALRHFTASVKSVQDGIDIQRALDNYLKHIKTNRTEEQFIKKGSTWFNNWNDWIEYKPVGTTTRETNPDTVKKIEEEHKKKQHEWADKVWAEKQAAAK